MKVSQVHKVNNSLNKLMFYDLNYRQDLKNITTSILELGYENLYLSFGRIDVSCDIDDIEGLNLSIHERIKKNGRLDLIYQRTLDNFAYSAYYKVSNKDNVVEMVLDLFNLYYSCSINFFENKKDYSLYNHYVSDLYHHRDIDNKRLYDKLNYNYSLFKPLAYNEIYLTYDKECELPSFIKSKITPSIMKRGVLHKLKKYLKFGNGTE